MQFFKSIDILLFLTINTLPHNQFAISFFSTLSGIGTYGFVWILVAIFLVWWEGKNRYSLYGLAIAGGLSIAFSEILLKNIIHRSRPELILSFTYLVDSTETFSFPSTHATMAFASSWILSYSHPRWKYALYLLAFLIAFSRIYLGKHFPSDVIAGGILGTVIGVTAEKILQQISKGKKSIHD